MLDGEDANKAAGLAWYDEEGFARLSAKTYATGQSSFQCLDTKGQSRIAMTTQTSGESSVQWRDVNNKLRIGASTKSNGDALMIWLAPTARTKLKFSPMKMAWPNSPPAVDSLLEFEIGSTPA